MKRLLTRQVSLTVSGEPKRVTATEAIVLQLMQKAMSGNPRVWRALLKYLDFARSCSVKSTELKFVETEYTRALADSSLGSDDG
jgi:hypothetical protein